LGYPVEATQGATGGYRLVAGTAVPPLLLDDDEAVAIVAGLRAAAGPVTEGLGEAAVRALAKLERVLPSRLRARVAALASATMAVHRPGPAVDADVLAELAVAVAGRQYLRFTYRAAGGETTARRVEPLRLVAARGLWYLVAYDTGRGDWRTFRADRVAGPRATGGRIPQRDLPAADAAAYVAQSLRSLPKPHEATFVVHGPAGEVRPVVRWADAEVEPLDDTRCSVRVRADSIDWLVSTVAVVAVLFDLDIDGPPEVLDGLRQVRDRLRHVAR
ncbi:MAG: helix-turn-helix transcriptional regulator, partial [Acidimicrobiales bacterium]